MAGIERLEIHSKSYIVRWVKVEDGHTLSWSVQPHKKSINFGIVKHPGTGATTHAQLNSENSDDNVSNATSSRLPKKEAANAQDLLASKGFIPLEWFGRCDADKVSKGVCNVGPGRGGMYGLVFDNTFSKQTSKTATCVMITYPTDAPPQASNPLSNQGAHSSSSQASLPKYTTAKSNGSADSLQSLDAPRGKGRPSSAGRSDSGTNGASGSCYVGTLNKRRRKKGQGYARRFFSLDYSSCTLSYYHNRASSALRGSIPLSLAAIAADEMRREISIDSGAEVWHLKALTDKDFSGWAQALEKASRVGRGLQGPSKSDVYLHKPYPDPAGHLSDSNKQQQDWEWRQVESLVSRVVGTRDALRRLSEDLANTGKKKEAAALGIHLSPGAGPAEDSDGYFSPVQQEKRSFWKRKPSAQSTPPPPSLLSPPIFQSAAALSLAVPSPSATPTLPTRPPTSAKRLTATVATAGLSDINVREHCEALLQDLDSVVTGFTALIGSSKRRRAPPAPRPADTRNSIDTVSSTADEFFDAEAGDEKSRIVRINHSEDGEESPDSDGNSAHDSSSVSSIDADVGAPGSDKSRQLYPSMPKSLAPLPVEAVERRKTIPASKAPPPSLFGLVRKNVGKDLSNISMPVSTNEPLSMLQKFAEQLEYAELLDQAAGLKTATERLLYLTAFAVSHFSNGRIRERAVRKPFNPLLGETFELVRSDNEVPGGFRLVAEKVCHRPVRLALQADAARWSFAQSPAPGQKFWGKSVELTTEGKVRIALRLPGGEDELYSWNTATIFLCNAMVGEKYVEPSDSMTVSNDTTGARAVVKFRRKSGLFGGRSEDVEVETYDSDGTHTGQSLVGNWTTSLRIVEAGKAGAEIWRAGSLVEGAERRYGMTTFAAQLNEITTTERGKLPCTDSRLRPDQRLVEEGDLDAAEEWKTKLEEAQRVRRREMEAKGEKWKPRWFTIASSPSSSGEEGSTGAEEVWRLKSGKDGYWEERARGALGGGVDIFKG